MSKHIITAIRQQSQLHGPLLLAAIELAHRADGNNGIVQISYSYLASKCHQSRRTAIRHVNRLIAMGIIRCQRFWQPGNKWGVNRYIFLIRWEKAAQTGNGDRMSSKLPNHEDKEKYGSLEEEKKSIQQVLNWLTPGGVVWRLAGGEG
jgi:Helix-turn-helix domain